MLMQKFSFAFLGAACLWAVLLVTIYSQLSNDWQQYSHPTWSFAIHFVAVLLNTFALRWMGLCWQPRVEAVEKVDG
jgi:membrane protein DedA with SNARE-associated domain